MDEYIIGAGAVLTAGPQASIAGATLHAQTDAGLASVVHAALIDFEAAHLDELSRIVIVAPGWSSSRFEGGVIEPLLARRECTMADVVTTLAQATGQQEVHVFARWLPDATMTAGLASIGVALVSHPLEAIDQASLVSGKRLSRWQSPFRAA
jgi:hypothetical protein